MASATTTVPPPQNPTPDVNTVASGRAARGGSRAASSSNGSRGRGRGRGNRGHRTDAAPHRQRPQQTSLPQRPAPPRAPPDDLGGGGVSGLDPTRDAATHMKGQFVVPTIKREETEDVEAEVCFICASPVTHNSIAPCNHRTCHICALRLRALYKTRACAHCRAEANYVIFTDDPNKRFEEFGDKDIEHTDETLGVKYTQKDIHEETRLLLRYNCPNAECDIACWGWPDLHRHVKKEHQKVMCDLCTRNKKVFTHEHELFTPQELRKHEKFGDDNPGAVDQSGFKGHPECGFCRQRFYGDDDLYVHCREKHEKCHICDRRGQGRQQQYYVNYDSLEQHFRTDHFMCPDQECLEKKFVVFESEMDLKAHQLEVHPNGLTKDARRDARRVDMSGFDYREPHQEPRRGRGDRDGRGRGRGRGRDPNSETLPQSTAQSMSRDELAFQRQMAIQTSQSTTPRTFGSQLTPTETYAARPPSRSPDTTTAPRNPTSSNPSFPAIDNLNLTSTSSNTASQAQNQALTPQQQARQIHHAAIIERAGILLHHNAAKVTSFRDGVSAYKNNAISANNLIDKFFTLFDCPSSDLGKLFKELADLYESEPKRNELLKAWNDWRAINEDYPSLPGPNGILPVSSSGNNAAVGGGGHRVLKLKSSTAQSSRSAVSKQRSWGNAAASANQFPAISNTGSIARVGTTTPWVTTTASGTSPNPSRPASTAPKSQQQQQQPKPGSADAFPALPMAPKPNTLMAGLSRGTVRWDDGRGASPVSAWGGVVVDRGERSGEASVGKDAGQVEEVGGKKKGKQAKKEVLYKFG
ncbi:uncharacterized protein KY384_008916 [Bacidia gigantensis]|uniref:uncharacterized protein n=1 Tax=Bacidia gigantensis TaxID=2732470 RepID=UPI001D04D8A1|nr:uncharacterized protein KY384_008916 [Bacidia gigantensis]KAG8525272.1 hypothetical protein KY384_008916 [Bacidia gigantensis]